MIIGRDAIVMSVDDAKRILEAARMPWERKRIKALCDTGLLDAVDRLHDAVREIERDDT